MYLLLCILQLGFLEVLDNQSTPKSSVTDRAPQTPQPLSGLLRFLQTWPLFLSTWYISGLLGGSEVLLRESSFNKRHSTQLRAFMASRGVGKALPKCPTSTTSQNQMNPDRHPRKIPNSCQFTYQCCWAAQEHLLQTPCKGYREELSSLLMYTAGFSHTWGLRSVWALPSCSGEAWASPELGGFGTSTAACRKKARGAESKTWGGWSEPAFALSSLELRKKKKKIGVLLNAEVAGSRETNSGREEFIL